MDGDRAYVRFFDWFDPRQQADADAFHVLDDHTIVARTPSCCLTGRSAVGVTNPYGMGGGEFTFIARTIADQFTYE
jgi:hypothetical protein